MADENDQGTRTDDGSADDERVNDRTDSQEGSGDDGGGDGSQDDTGRTDASDENDDDPRMKRLRRENAATRRRLREAEAERDRLREQTNGKGKGDDDDDTAEQLRQERAARESDRRRLRRVSVRAEIATLAPGMRLADVDTALALLRETDPDLGMIEWKDDEPVAESVKDALADLVENKPFLVVPKDKGVARSGSGGGSGAGGGGEPPKETADQRLARVRGGGGQSMFDPEVAKRMGGGVVQG